MNRFDLSENGIRFTKAAPAGQIGNALRAQYGREPVAITDPAMLAGAVARLSAGDASETGLAGRLSASISKRDADVTIEAPYAMYEAIGRLAAGDKHDISLAKGLAATLGVELTNEDELV